MIKIFIVLAFACGSIYCQQTISGKYFLGDKKVSISADEMSYWLIYEEEHISDRLQYEENTLENDQIWLVWRKGNQVGTIVFKSDYSSGIYKDYRTGQEQLVKKIE